MGLGYIFSDKARFGKVGESGVKLERVSQHFLIEIDDEGLKPADQRCKLFSIYTIKLIQILVSHIWHFSAFKEDQPEVLRINQAFVFTITHRNLMLFAGRVDNPTTS